MPASVAQFAAVYAAAHFALLYAYQLPELSAVSYTHLTLPTIYSV